MGYVKTGAKTVSLAAKTSKVYNVDIDCSSSYSFWTIPVGTYAAGNGYESPLQSSRVVNVVNYRTTDGKCHAHVHIENQSATTASIQIRWTEAWGT